MVVVLISRLGVEHFVGKAKVIIRTCEKYGTVLSSIVVRPFVVTDDLLAGLVTLRRAAWPRRMPYKLKIPGNVYWKLFNIAHGKREPG